MPQTSLIADPFAQFPVAPRDPANPWAHAASPRAGPRRVDFEGRVHEFPDDATNEEIAAALDREYPAPAKQPGNVPPPPPALKPVTDPAILAQLNAPPGMRPVTDPKLLAQLNGAPAAEVRSVDHDPFAPAGPKLTPVDYDPFAPTARPEPSPIPAGMQGASRSAADTLGLLPDIVNMGANAVLAGTDFASRKLGGPDINFRFPMASDAIANTASRVASAAGVPVLDPEKMSEREKIAYNVNRFGGQAALTAGVLAPVATARAASAATRMPKVGDALLRPYEAAPILTTVGDTVAGAGAGAGLAASQSLDVKDKFGPIASAIADLTFMGAGAGAGGGAAGIATRGPSYVKNAVTKNLPDRAIPKDPETNLPTPNAVADRTARFVQSQTSDPAAAAGEIKSAAEAFRNMGAPVPTSGAASRDPKLMALERGQRRLEPGAFAERDIALRDAALENVDSIRPQGVDPRVATNFIGGVAKRRIDDAFDTLRTSEQRLAAADSGERSLAGNVGQFAGRGSAASADLDRLVTDRSLVPAQQRKNELYGAIDPERNVMRRVDPLVELAGEIERSVAEIPAALQREMIPQQLINDIRGMARRTEERTIASPLLDSSGQPITRTEQVTVGGTGEMSFGSMNEMRSGLASASTAARKAGQYRLAENLDRFRSFISRESEALASEGGPAGDRARAASEFYREEFAPTWNRGPGDEANRFRKDFNTDRTNRTTTPPTATAGRFLTTGAGAAEKAEALSRIVSSMAEPADQVAATAAVRQYVMDDLTRTIGTDGKINPQSLARWLNGTGGWNDALGQFPAVQAEARRLLADVQAGRTNRNAMATAAERAAANVKRTQDQIDHSALSLVIGREPTKAARAVLESRDPLMAMREVRQTIGGHKAAQTAWERAVTDHLVNRITNVDPAGVSAGERSINYAKLVKTFDQYAPALAELYAGQPEKMNALRQAQKILEPLARQSGPATSAVPRSDNSLAGAWKVLEIGLKGVYGILKGGGVLRTLKVAASFGADDTANVQRLVTRMMFDPELAQHLLTRPVAEVNTPAWNERLARILRRTQVGREVLGGREE